MGIRGPSPTPTRIKLIRGNPGKRKLNDSEPQPQLAAPECPEYLDEMARVEWDRLVEILLAMRVLTEADYIALGNLCQAYSTMIDAQKKLSKAGVLYRTKSGYVQQSPLLGIVNSQMTLINALVREFGLTPSSRTRVSSIAEPRKENRFANLCAYGCNGRRGGGRGIGFFGTFEPEPLQ